MQKIIYYLWPRFCKFGMIKQAFQDEVWMGTFSTKTGELQIHDISFTLDDYKQLSKKDKLRLLQNYIDNHTKVLRWFDRNTKSIIQILYGILSLIAVLATIYVTKEEILSLFF